MLKTIAEVKSILANDAPYYKDYKYIKQCVKTYLDHNQGSLSLTETEMRHTGYDFPASVVEAVSMAIGSSETEISVPLKGYTFGGLMEKEKRIKDEINGGLLKFINEKNNIIKSNKEQTEKVLTNYFMGYDAVEYSDKTLGYQLNPQMVILTKIKETELKCSFVFIGTNKIKQKAYAFVNYTAEDIIKNLHEQICNVLQVL
jgi:hypothetical protein